MALPGPWGWGDFQRPRLGSWLGCGLSCSLFVAMGLLVTGAFAASGAPAATGSEGVNTSVKPSAPAKSKSATEKSAPEKSSAQATGAKGSTAQATAKTSASNSAPMASAEEPAAEAVSPPDIMERLRERLARRMAGAPLNGASAPASAATEGSPGKPSARAGAAKPASAPSASGGGNSGQGGTVRVLSRSPNGDVMVRAVPASSLQVKYPSRTPSAGAARKPSAADSHWSYVGPSGPEHWGKLKPEFGACANGRRQSPVDLRDGISVDLEPVVFHYQPSAFSVIDNGHTVEVRVAPGNSIEVLGRRFTLKQFHFHRPSEERIDGHGFDMSIHLVHVDEQGKLAVVALLVTQGQAQAQIQTVWNNLPLEKGEEWPARVPIDPSALLPDARGYYTYMGSLTTPPCSEGVLWLVLKTPVELSAEQVGIFSRLYPMNARPIQGAAGRLVKQSR